MIAIACGSTGSVSTNDGWRGGLGARRGADGVIRPVRGHGRGARCTATGSVRMVQAFARRHDWSPSWALWSCAETPGLIRSHHWLPLDTGDRVFGPRISASQPSDPHVIAVRTHSLPARQHINKTRYSRFLDIRVGSKVADPGLGAQSVSSTRRPLLVPVARARTPRGRRLPRPPRKRRVHRGKASRARRSPNPNRRAPRPRTW